MTTEENARLKYDTMLKSSAWDIQSKVAFNLSIGHSVTIRGLSFKIGEPDYSLFVNGKAVGTTVASPEGQIPCRCLLRKAISEKF